MFWGGFETVLGVCFGDLWGGSGGIIFYMSPNFDFLESQLSSKGFPNHSKIIQNVRFTPTYQQMTVAEKERFHIRLKQPYPINTKDHN